VKFVFQKHPAVSLQRWPEISVLLHWLVIRFRWWTAIQTLWWTVYSRSQWKWSIL